MGRSSARPLYAVERKSRRGNLRGRPQNRAGAGAVSCVVVHMNLVEVHFEDRAARVWQVIDPNTEMLLDEGEWSDPDVPVSLPEGDGVYRVQITTLSDRTQFTFVDAQVTDGRLIAEAPLKISAAALI